jgi:hypothetical protein
MVPVDGVRMDSRTRDPKLSTGGSLGAQRESGGSLPRVPPGRVPEADGPPVDEADEESSIVRVQRVRARLAATSPLVGPVEPGGAVARDVVMYLMAFAAGAGLGVGAILVLAGQLVLPPAAPPAPTHEVVAGAYARLDDAPLAAADSFRQVLAADPDDVAAQAGLGQALMLLGEPREGERWLCRASLGSGSHADAARVLVRLNAIVCP